MRRVLSVGVSTLLAALLAGCGGTSVTLAVSPKRALADHPLDVRVGGGDHPTVRLETVDADGQRWRATAKPGADLGRRLVDALRPADGSQNVFVAPKRWTMTVSVREGGSQVASRTVTRLQPVADGFATETRIRKATQGGLHANLFEPARPRKGGTAVVLIGGSEGGTAMDRAGALLAAHGYPSLVVGYFGVPGRPGKLARIQLEYFHRAVRRLAQAPHVDRNRIVVLGASRGSEAALLTATYWPGEVAAVVAAVPSAVAGATPGDKDVPAWTYAGKPVPWTRIYGSPDAADNPKAIIDVARIRGPILLVCGEADQIWPSCPYARAIQERATSRTRLLSYDESGHLVGVLVPGSPLYLTAYPGARPTPYGGTPASAAAARDDAWPKLLDFLAQVR